MTSSEAGRSVRTSAIDVAWRYVACQKRWLDVIFFYMYLVLRSVSRLF